MPEKPTTEQIQQLKDRLEEAEQVLFEIALERQHLNAPGPRDWFLGTKLVEMAERYFEIHPRPKPPPQRPKNQDYLAFKTTAAETHSLIRDRRRKGELFSGE